MIKKFPYIIFVAAILISICAGVFSVYGLSRLFSGSQFAIILFIALEVANVIIAGSLKLYWSSIPKWIRNYLMVSSFFLIILTSAGIYGFLSDAYQKTAMKDEIVSRRSGLIKSKKDNFQSRLIDFKKELDGINVSTEELTKSLNINSQYQTTGKNGQVLTQIQVGSKKPIESQLNKLNERKEIISSKIDSYQDSIQNLEIGMIELEANNQAASELGPLKYLSGLTGFPMNKVVNWFLIIIVIVTEPLAIALILTSLFAFSKLETDKLEEERKAKELELTKEEIERKVEVPIIPVENIPIPKRKYSRKPKLEIPIEEEPEIHFDIEIPGMDPLPILEEEQPIQAKPKKKRKVVDNNLTPDIASHISDSLNKKKVKPKN